MRHLVIFIPSIERGGVEKNLFLITNFLAKKFKKIYIVTINSNFKYKFNKKKLIFISPKSNKWINKPRIFKYFFSLILLIKHFKNKKILIFSFQGNILAILASLILDSKIIIRLNTSPEKYINNFYKKIFFSFFYKIVDRIIVNSDKFKKSLKDSLNLKSSKIYNPTGMSGIRNYKIKFFHGFKGLKILSIGRLTDQKDHMTLLKSASFLRKNSIKFKLYIIGQGYKHIDLKNFIKSEGLTKSIKLGGYKKNAFNYLKSSDLFILSSRYEGLPNVLIEAQKLKIPIISSNCMSGPSEILLNGKLGDLFKVGDYYGLYKKIKGFIKNKKTLIKKTNLGQKYLYRFNDKDNCNKYYFLIKRYIKLN